jgi:hypothetical protein
MVANRVVSATLQYPPDRSSLLNVNNVWDEVVTVAVRFHPHVYLRLRMAELVTALVVMLITGSSSAIAVVSRVPTNVVVGTTSG